MAGADLRTVEWVDGKVLMIDQTLLPSKLERVEYDTYQGVADAIKRLVVRGAPAIGVSGAFGMALAAQQSGAQDRDALLADLAAAKKVLAATRPTAVNLEWALEQMMAVAKDADGGPDDVRRAVRESAAAMADNDITINKKMGSYGSELFDDGDTIMTHCNAGALATVAYGTALGTIRAAHDGGKNVRVIATETRPVQQGSRLTAFELHHDGIDVSIIPDTAVGYSMAQGLVDKVIVGADRVLRTGHVFNKIGTYQVAVMAKRHGVPFYVAAPISTFDMKGDPGDVTIEQRSADEVLRVGQTRTAPDGVGVINPAFDMTPPELITGIVTEMGTAYAPLEESIAALFAKPVQSIKRGGSIP